VFFGGCEGCRGACFISVYFGVVVGVLGADEVGSP